MTAQQYLSHCAKALVTLVVLFLLICPSSGYATSSAEIQAELDAAQATLETLYGEAEQTGYELEQAKSNLEETREQIAEVQEEIIKTEAELASAQETLSNILSNNYKNGTVSVLSVILESTSFEDFISRVYYANKFSHAQEEAIDEVRALQQALDEQRAELEEQEAVQEALVEELTLRQAAADAAVAEAQAYYDSLSEELKDAIAAEEAAASQVAQEAAEAYSDTIESNGGSTTTVVPSGSVSAMVSRAYSVIGAGYQYSGYVWTGDISTSYFTCSGLVDFAMGYSSNSNSPESLYARVGSRMVYSVEELNYGDLVFSTYSGRYPGHVGIYIGNGMMIDSCPSGGVQIRSAYDAFIGGGPIY